MFGRYGLLLALLVFVAGCTNRGSSESKLPESVGSPYEILVVTPEEYWKGELGDTLRAILSQEVYQSEKEFDLKSVVPERMRNVLLNYRNIIVAEVGEQYKESKISVAYDVYATPQVVLYAQSSSIDSLIKFTDLRAREIYTLFMMSERDRYVKQTIKNRDAQISDSVRKVFGIDIAIPKGYKIMNTIGNNFMWISNEMPISSQGIIIYSHPANRDAILDIDYLVASKNNFSMLIPGPSDGSYMKTSDVITPILNETEINGIRWAKLIGYWDVYGDFMGGPFIGYTTLNRSKKNQLITIDQYVFSPKPKKGIRTYMKQLESIMYTVSFPDELQQKQDSVVSDAKK